MFNKVHNYIKEHNMLEKGDRIVIGVSGGADSVCLFHVLFRLVDEYNLKLFVVHVNHGIRKIDADLDEAYVKELCDQRNVTFRSLKVDVKKIGKRDGLSEEEAGRLIRYEEFYRCYEENKCNKIAIAHNKNDNAETILFHLFRGSGMKGLSGILPVRDEIIRPLLGIERIEIEHYLKEKEIKYCNDYTNETDDYSRNRIRHHILGYAKDYINVRATNNIVHAGNQIREVYKFLEKNIDLEFDKTVTFHEKETAYEIDIHRLMLQDTIIQRGIVRKIFYLLAGKLKDVEFDHTDLVLSLMKKQVGKRLNMPYGITALRGYSGITMFQNKENNWKGAYNEGVANVTPIALNELSETLLEVLIPGFNKTIGVKLINYKKNMIIPQNGCTKWFDYDKIKNTVLIRTRAAGDFIEIDGKGSKKKIKSFFIDEKIPREERDYKLLVADGSHIMWIIGSRISEGYKVNEETKVILEISLNGGR
jgi:tRNA(Ile)-lysidine synthase